MTTQHTHPEYGDVDAQDVAQQHAPEMQESPDESTPSTSPVQVEQSNQSNPQEDAIPVSPALRMPSFLSFSFPNPSSTPAAEEATVAIDQERTMNQVNNESSEMPGSTEDEASSTTNTVESTALAEEISLDAQGDEVAVSAVQVSESDEQVTPEPEPASFSLVHDTAQDEATVQEQQEQPTASNEQTEQDEAVARSFTEYFEEFRQSEARSLANAPDSFTEFALSNTTTPFNDDESTPSQAPGTHYEEVLPPFDFGEGSAFIPAENDPTSSAIVNENDPSTQSLMEAAVSEENQRAAAAGQENAETMETERPVSPLLRPANRHRLRHAGPSHREEFVRSQGNETSGSESLTESSTAQPVNETQLSQSPQPQDAQGQDDSNTVEIPAEVSKPTRRYRFDRPAQPGTQRAYGVSSVPPSSTNGGSTIPAASKATENATAWQVPTTQPTQPTQPTQSSISSFPVAQQVSPMNTPTEEMNSTAMGVSAIQPPEEQALKQESATLEQSASTQGISSPPEHGRRRHTQERQHEKEPQVTAITPDTTATPSPETTPTSVSDIAALIADTHDAIQGDVPPEDLPPLEYADLQKGNPRRRRRHRNGQTVTTPVSPKAQEVKTPEVKIPEVKVSEVSIVQETPIIQVGQILPVTQEVYRPMAPAAAQSSQPVPLAAAQGLQPVPPLTTEPASQASSSYTLTSGYTVNQMNQGNDAVGPFMGPEPSPARGSVFSRDGRTTRAENMRPTSYAPRDNGATGGGPSSASMSHFANVVAQAIQVQSDRMVAEMRRVSQSPTNVSVSLPPFPSTERVGVFVDVANLLYSARTMRIAIDFGKLLDFLRGNRRLVRAQAYCPTSPQPGDEQMFLTAVKGLGYRITTKNYKTFASGAKKADLDLDLCMDVVRLVDGRAVDCIVLVSGDSDFMPMLDYCSDHGVRVEIAAFDEAMSATLRQSCDLFVNLSMLEEIRA